MEHPFYGSWGYQVTGLLRAHQPLRHAAGLHVPGRHAAPARHRRDPRLGAGALSRATSTAWRYFDGTHLYEHADPRQGDHPDWGTLHLQLRPPRGAELPASPTPSSGCERYHVDGLRVDAVASMLYLDYSRKRRASGFPTATAAARTWRRSTSCSGSTSWSTASYPDVLTIAEESTAWPMVTRPAYLGGLGFGFKWNMGWMHDTLQYLQRDPVHRQYHHNELTFRDALRLSPRTSCCRCRTTRWCTARARCSARCRATTGRSSPTCALLLRLHVRTSRARSCSSWAASSASGREWNHDTSLDWHLLRGPDRAPGDLRLGAGPEPALLRSGPST